MQCLATSPRPSQSTFFLPDAQWQFSSVRLARDAA